MFSYTTVYFKRTLCPVEGNVFLKMLDIYIKVFLNNESVQMSFYGCSTI